MRRIVRTLGLLIFALCSVAWGQQDVFITGTNSYVVLGRGLSWASGVNNNFIFSPLNPNTQACVYVTNNNPTNSHTLTITLWQAGDPQVKTFQNLPAKWAQSATTQTFPITVNSSSTKGVFFNVTAAAQLTAQITGGTAAGGSPDTADIFVVQTTSGQCGLTSGGPVTVQGVYNPGTSITSTSVFPVGIGGYSNPAGTTSIRGLFVNANGSFDAGSNGGNTTWSNAFNTVSAYFTPLGNQNTTESPLMYSTASTCSFGTLGLSPGCVKTNILEVATDQTILAGNVMPAWSENANVTNPGANSLILEDALTSGATHVSYKTAVLSCSAACELRIFAVSTTGTGCGAVTPSNFNVYGGTRKAFTAGHSSVNGTGCSVQPSTVGTAFFDVNIAAGTSQTIDLSGIINQFNTTTSGLAVFNVSSLTGTATATFTLVED